MTIKILKPEDRIIVPDYAALCQQGLQDVSGFYSDGVIQSARLKYSSSYIANHLAPNSKHRYVGHFSNQDQDLDGILIESFDNMDGARTCINWVFAKRKNSGIGSALIKDCVERAREEGKDNVSLVVSSENIAARRLYTKLGFVMGEPFESDGRSYELMGYVFKPDS